MDMLEGQHRCVKRAYAGTILGVVMGGFASVGNVLVAHGTNTLNVLSRDSGVRKATFHRSIRSVGAMTVFSGLLQTTKCLLDERKVQEPEYTAALVTVCFAPWLPIAAIRAEMPWMLVLFGMDFYHTRMRTTPS